MRMVLRSLLIGSLLRSAYRLFQGCCAAALGVVSAQNIQALSVESDFEGASVKVVEVRADSQTIRFMPGGDPQRGWPCWWYFRLTDIDTAKPLVLELQGSDAVLPEQHGQAHKPLASDWAMPVCAAISTDGKTWKRSEAGHKEGSTMTYQLKPESKTLLVAWGPPYTPSHAAEFVHQCASASANALEMELCKSGASRAVPMLVVSEGDRTAAQRFGIWVSARQHAWESGSSWVCEGFAEWLLGDDPTAQWLRQNAEIRIIPIMDIDNTATGNGGKEAVPQDHNRDWSDKPHWNEVSAAQKEISQMVQEGRMDLFLDLHNPAPNDKEAYFFVPVNDLLAPEARGNRERFLKLAGEEITPIMPMLAKPKETGPSYHPLWRQISCSWVQLHGNPKTVAVCLETPWNTPRSTVEGYKAVGTALARAVQKFVSAGK